MVEFDLIDEIFDVKSIKKQVKDVEDIVTSLKDSLKKTADQLLQLSKNANFDTNLKSITERQKQIIELSGKASKAIDELTKKERECGKLIA